MTWRTKDEVIEPEHAKRFYTLLNGKKSYLEILNKTHDLLGDEKELIDAIWLSFCVANLINPIKPYLTIC